MKLWPLLQRNGDLLALAAEVAIALVVGAAFWFLFGNTALAVGAALGYWIAGERARVREACAAAKHDLIRAMQNGTVVMGHESACSISPCTCTPVPVVLRPEHRPSEGDPS